MKKNSEGLCFRESRYSVNWLMIDNTAGMIKITTSYENPTAVRVTIPKLLVKGKLARQSVEKPKKLASPETVMAVPIFCTLSWIAATGS